MKKEKMISQVMRLLGRKTSPKKAEASRRNGKLGGAKRCRHNLPDDDGLAPAPLKPQDE